MTITLTIPMTIRHSLKSATSRTDASYMNGTSGASKSRTVSSLATFTDTIPMTGHTLERPGLGVRDTREGGACSYMNYSLHFLHSLMDMGPLTKANFDNSSEIALGNSRVSVIPALYSGTEDPFPE